VNLITGFTNLFTTFSPSVKKVISALNESSPSGTTSENQLESPAGLSPLYSSLLANTVIGKLCDCVGLLF